MSTRDSHKQPGESWPKTGVKSGLRQDLWIHSGGVDSALNWDQGRMIHGDIHTIITGWQAEEWRDFRVETVASSGAVIRLLVGWWSITGSLLLHVGSRKTDGQWFWPRPPLIQLGAGDWRAASPKPRRGGNRRTERDWDWGRSIKVTAPHGGGSPGRRHTDEASLLFALAAALAGDVQREIWILLATSDDVYITMERRAYCVLGR